MAKKILLSALLFSTQTFAVYEVGDRVADMCWKDRGERMVCLADAAGTVRVLLYGAGYCPPCNDEFQELVPKVKEFDNKPVTFISLSAAGWQGGLKPTTQFLNEWRDKHNIPFTVAAAPKDPGADFGSEGIPFVAIIDKQDKLAYKALMPGVETVLNQVRALVGSKR